MKKRFTDEERAQRDLESKRRYKEKIKAAKKLAPSQVARSDKGRTVAETKQGGGAARPTGTEKAKTVEEATKRVAATATPVEEKPSILGTVTELRAPTKAEINMIRSVMDPANEPLVQIERDLESMGVVGDTQAVLEGRALVKRGEIPASEKELDTAATMTAGTLVNFAPNLLIYLYPVGLVFFTLGFVGSRLVIFLRIKRAMDELEKVKKQAMDEQAARSKFNPGAQTIGNGAQTPHAEPARTA